MADYLAERRNLGGVVLLVDPRQGLTELDQQLLQFVAPRVGNGEVKLLVVLTKADKLSRNEGAKALAAAQKVLADLATDDARHRRPAVLGPQPAGAGGHRPGGACLGGDSRHGKV